MEDKTIKGYIAGGLFLIIGIIVFIMGIDSGWSSGKFNIIIGGILSLLGGGSIWKPDSIGQVLAHVVKNMSDKQAENNTQSQNNTKNSNQTIARDNAKVIHNHYNITSSPDEKDEEHDEDVIWTCDDCEEEFDSEEELDDHLETCVDRRTF